MLNTSKEDVGSLPPDFLESIANEDCVLAYISIPCATLSLLTIILIFVALAKSSFNQDSIITIWKPRTVFEGRRNLNILNKTILIHLAA